MQDDKLTLERHFAEAQALTLPDDQFRRWRACTSGHRFMAAKSKRIVCYSLLLGQPLVGRVLELRDLSISFEEGITSTWTFRGGEIKVGHTPTEVYQGCFIWHNHLSLVEFARLGKRREARLAMTWKTPRNPQVQLEGVNYMLEQYVFDNYEWEAV